MKKIINSLAILALLTMTMFACQPKDPEVNQPIINKTVMEVLRSDMRYSTLVAAIERAGLVTTFNTPLNPVVSEGAVGDSITLLAPDNDAFTRAGINVATIDINTLTQVLLYHVPVVGRELGIGVPAPGASENNTFRNGQMPNVVTPTVNSNPEIAFLRMRNTASVTEIFPATVPTNNNNRIFINRTGATGVIVSINGIARVNFPNVICANGIFHGIDRVLMPPYIAGGAGNGNLYDLIAANPNYSRVKYIIDKTPATVTALQTLTNTRTIFIPTDAAFDAAVPQITTAYIDANVAAVTAVLNYHISSARIFSTNINNTGLANTGSTTVNNPISTTGFGLATTIVGNDVIFNNNTSTRIIGAISRSGRVDQMAVNGVLHEVNAVLSPVITPTQTVEQIAAGNPDLTLLAQALTATGVTLTGASIGTVASASTPNLPAAFAGPYTVFAPTNAALTAAGYDAARLTAIAAQPAGSQDKVALANILRGHVLPNRLFSFAATNGSQNTLLWNGVPFIGTVGTGNTLGTANPNGTPNQTNSPTVINYRQITVSVSGGEALFSVRGTRNSALIPITSTRNVLGSNGVVHVIDNVLLF
ncbi:MAG: hypothetical protein EAZ44_03065 [Cytophagia bacterium]|nr:MAG: hypothetical protein EAZ44_03065 [Cytophagia bacterium]TAG43685.1 MAG: hypothetical protein EAZ31_03700 [Cytophagia bacterium]